jgi:hypothetical protein
MNDQTQGTANGFSQDEISITDLLLKLWQRRGLIVVLPIVFLLLAVTFLFFTAVKTQSPTVFFVQLHGIDKATYPNGTSFSPQDLLVPEVLMRVASQLNLPMDDDLRKSIQIEYGVPTTVGLQRKYQETLANKKLSAVEINVINDAYQEELLKTTQGGLRITIDHLSLGLSPDQGAVLANALPRAWADVFTQKYRVLVDTRLDNISVSNKDNALTTTSEILSARSTLKRMFAGIKALNADNRLKAIVSDGGLNSSDILGDLEDFRELYFTTIFSGLFANPDAVADSFQTEVEFKITEITLEIEELNRSLIDLKNFGTQTSPNQMTNNTSDTVQFGDSSLKQVVELANQASLSDFVQQVLTSRRELINKRAGLQTEINRTTGGSLAILDTTFLTAASLKLSILKNEYISLLHNAREIRRQAYGDFYVPLGSPYVIGSLFPPKSILVLTLSVMLGGILAIMLSLVLPIRRK